MEKIEKIIKVMWRFFNGKFGHKVLKKPLRRWWRLFWFSLNVWLFFHYIMCPIFRWWDGVVDYLDYIIWG